VSVTVPVCGVPGVINAVPPPVTDTVVDETDVV
jgi:hypothetical protein